MFESHKLLTRRIVYFSDQKTSRSFFTSEVFLGIRAFLSNRIEFRRVSSWSAAIRRRSTNTTIHGSVHRTSSRSRARCTHPRQLGGPGKLSEVRGPQRVQYLRVRVLV
ncbi:hypothetical protein PUN28_000192 [Cardiocondyla obscurior]|uniref:Uncharacterized protein n=1 Tax=Cardiocondyla obscurior TaxID=286306 RepID=A0AAW2GY49_9HYME